MLEQPEPLVEVRARARGLERHQRPPFRACAAGGDLVLGDPERGELVLRQVDAAELPVLAHVAHDVDQLQRHPERLRPLDVVGAVDRDAGHADSAGDAPAVAVELGEVRVAVLLGVLQPAVHEVVQRVRRDLVARAGVGERDEHRVLARSRVERGAQLLQARALLVDRQLAVGDVVHPAGERVDRRDRLPLGRAAAP